MAKSKRIPILTDKQRQFCKEYVKDWNATQAAIRAGYSPRSARQLAGINLALPIVKDYLATLPGYPVMQGGDVVKLLGDMARSCLNDYFVIKQAEHTPRISKPLQQLIDELQAEIDLETEYAALASLSATEQKAHETRQLERRRELLHYELELKRNPDAQRIVNGPTVFIEQAELDLVKLVRDREAGKIKTIAYGKYGPRVEMYAADVALRDVARLTGKPAGQADPATQGEKLPGTPITFIPAESLTPQQIEKYLNNAAGPGHESIS